MSSFDADVIIVGAGPAGTMAAFELATSGISVLIFEKNSFPRYKVCGGGLTHKIIREIPFDLSPVIERTIHSVRFSWRFGEVFARTSADPLMYCTMRPLLDGFLLEKAIGAGAGVVIPGKVTEVRKEDDGITVLTEDRSYRGKLLIGADGAAGIVSRTFHLRTNTEKGLAWEAEIKVNPEILEKIRDTVFLDWGTFPGGYGWVFPKKDHVSVGVGGPAVFSELMMPYYIKFLRSCGIFDLPDDIRNPEKDIPGTISLKSWPIPVRTSKSRFHAPRVLIAGDAGGLSDALTGEGIYYAIRSGKLAAAAASEFLMGNAMALERYSENINDELMTELLEANKIKHIFNVVPGKIHRFVRDSDRAWRAFGKILRGERWYADVRNGFGRWRYFWNLATGISGMISRRNENKIRKTGSSYFG